jgi:N-acetylneuraminate synthase
MKSRYKNVRIGYSDHTLGVAVPLAAVVMGARVIEKHFTLSRKMYGSDAMNSMEPDEFKRLVDEVRQVELAIESGVDKDKKVKLLSDMKITFEKSIVSKSRISKFEVITEKHLAFKKPGNGLPARQFREILGKQINKDVEKDHLFTIKDFE